MGCACAVGSSESVTEPDVCGELSLVGFLGRTVSESGEEN